MRMRRSSGRRRRVWHRVLHEQFLHARLQMQEHFAGLLSALVGPPGGHIRHRGWNRTRSRHLLRGGDILVREALQRLENARHVCEEGTLCLEAFKRPGSEEWRPSAPMWVGAIYYVRKRLRYAWCAPERWWLDDDAMPDPCGLMGHRDERQQ